MAKVIVKNVGNPAEPKKTASGKLDAGTATRQSDGTEFQWFQLSLVQRRGIATVSAHRNFVVGASTGIDHEAAVEFMESGDSLGTDALGEDGVEIVSVDIEPMSFGDSENVVTKLNVIKLPGETIRQALSATNRDARLLGDAATTEAPVSEDELSEAAI